MPAKLTLIFSYPIAILRQWLGQFYSTAGGEAKRLSNDAEKAMRMKFKWTVRTCLGILSFDFA
jgi:hypothetical protein